MHIYRLLILTLTCGIVVCADGLMVFRELPKNEIERLNKNRNKIYKIGNDKYGYKFNGGDSNLDMIQKMIDDKIFEDNDEYSWQCLGVVLGDVWVKRLDMQWMEVEDEFGISPTVKVKNRDININPITIISKRKMKREDVDLKYLVVEVEKKIHEWLREKK